jgi:hypothetical protein
MNTHELKILPEYFNLAERGLKDFEIRKNDRGFKVFDDVVLHEWDGKAYTGRQLKRKITCVFADDFEGVEPGFCVIGTTSMPGA